MGKTNNSANVTVGKPKATGAFFAAPLGTKLPTDATSVLDAKFECIGYISEDGVTLESSTSTESIKAWGGDTVLTVATEREEKIKATFIEALNKTVLDQVFGADNVTENAGALTIKHTAVDRPRMIYVVDMLLTGGRNKRLVVPAGQISEVGETVYKDGEAVGYEVTISTYPDGEGTNIYEYLSAAAA